MSTAGARHCADVNGTFCGIDIGRGSDSTAILARTPQSQASQSAPLATRAVMDMETVKELARICGILPGEFVVRYRVEAVYE